MRCLIVIGWVIFASDDVSVLLLPYLGSMFGANGAVGGMDVYAFLQRRCS